MPRALLSVSDKTGLIEFARGLAGAGWTLLSTGGTAAALREAGLRVTDVSDVTGHPEIMEGRVKSLHPAIHGGLLARAGNSGDTEALTALGYETIDLVAVNLYPFHEAVAAGAAIDVAMDKVDIGGPAMLRAAAKNHARVLAVVEPDDYPRVLQAITDGTDDAALRRDLAMRVFGHTARYDAAVAAYFERACAEAGSPEGGDGGPTLPARLTLSLARVQPLRYGENPDQPACFYAEEGSAERGIPAMRQLHGKELSFNNLLDVDAATLAVSAWHPTESAACVLVKHTTPCGCALGENALDAYRRALAADPVSAFGGIAAFNVPVTGTAAAALAELFLEIVVAPEFEPAALDTLRQKKNLRLIQLPFADADDSELDFKRVRGGFLAQRRLLLRFPEDAWRVASEREPTDAEWRDLRFGWRAAAMVKSNAIVLARDRQTVGIGAGQMSRVDASRVAVWKADEHSGGAGGAALASDAFFPFRDGIDAAAEAGVTAVIQPGGSVRDTEVIDAANEHGIAMVFTGRRLFRH
jgi:phosphoribosylaminoimidazolecarboxamide formyltransferase / IMP cyclohydrolase